MRKKDRERLVRIAKGEETLKEVKLMGEPWFDDHIACVTARVNGIRVELWWIGMEGYAALKYANDSETAKKDALEVIRGQVENDLLPELES